MKHSFCIEMLHNLIQIDLTCIIFPAKFNVLPYLWVHMQTLNMIIKCKTIFMEIGCDNPKAALITHSTFTHCTQQIIKIESLSGRQSENVCASLWVCECKLASLSYAGWNFCYIQEKGLRCQRWMYSVRMSACACLNILLSTSCCVNA